MSDPTAEIISQYLDALHAGAAPPVAAFLARYPDLPARQAAGLARVLETARLTAPATVAEASRQASWEQIAARLDAGAVAAAAAPPATRAGRIYTRAVPAPALPWRISLGAAAILIFALAFILLRPPGSGLGSDTPPAAPTPAPPGVSRSMLPGAQPTAGKPGAVPATPTAPPPPATPVPTDTLAPPPTAPAASDLAEIRGRVGYSVFVPSPAPAGLTAEPPSGGARSRDLVEIRYHTADGALALLVTNGPAGCCLDADGRKAGTVITLTNGLTAHLLPGTPESGGPILWWTQTGTYLALSGPAMTRDSLVQIAGTLSPTAELGPTVAVTMRPTPSPIPAPAFTILRPTWLPAALTLREEYAQQPGPSGPVSTAMLHYDAPDGANGQDALLLIEVPKALAADPGAGKPLSASALIGTWRVWISRTNNACMNLAWIAGDVALTLVNSYDPPGQPRYSCSELTWVVQSVR